VETEPEAGGNRREEIRQGLGAIRARIDELRAEQQGEVTPAALRERIASAQRQLAASLAAADQAVAASVRAFRRAAEAHEQAGLQHERASAAGFGDRDQHERQAAIHRAAAVADTQRAERAESLLRDETTDDARGPETG
jgi:hypothetical protein